MQSIVSYKDRGNFGDSKYRGNCTGYIIKDFFTFPLKSKSKESKTIDIEIAFLIALKEIRYNNNT